MCAGGMVGLRVWNKKGKRRMIQVCLKMIPKSMHEAVETHFKTNQHLKETKQISQISFGVLLGTGSVLGRQNGAKWTNIDQHRPKGTKSSPKGEQNK